MKGILFVQLGTPDSPTTRSCRQFLREFLMDPDVIDIPFFARWLLVYGIISPFRSSKTAEAYRKIWTDRGSPLRVVSSEFEKKMQEKLTGRYRIHLGMRYGNPRLKESLVQFKEQNIQDLTVFPLFPQFAEATTGSIIKEVQRLLIELRYSPKLTYQKFFYHEDFFIQSWIEQSKKYDLKNFDHFLFSFHGLPGRQLTKSDPDKQTCLRSDRCCEIPKSFCYRSQCFATSKKIADGLQVPQDKVSVCFQSRLGKGWIQPYTDDLLRHLPSLQLKRVLVFSPSFVCDGLETLEEIEIRGKESFLAAGGEELVLVKSLNFENPWIENFARFFQG